MRRTLFLLTMLLAASGCQQFMDNTQRVGYNMRKEVVKTSNRISDYFRVDEHKPEPKRQAMAPRYCYRVLTDVVCYRNPQPGAEGRLVGYYEPPAGEDAALATRDSYTLPPEQQVNVKPLDPVGQEGAATASPQPLMQR